MKQKPKDIGKNIILAQIQCNNHLAYSEGCLDALAKALETLEELAKDADLIRMDDVRDVIMNMRSEVTRGKASFQKRAASLEKTKKLLSKGILSNALSQISAQQASKESSLILPAHYRR